MQENPVYEQTSLPNASLYNANPLSYALLIHVNKSATESFKSNSPSLPPAVIFPWEIIAKHISASSARSLLSGIPKPTFIWCSSQQMGVGNKSPRENLKVLTVRWLLISLGSNENHLFHFLCCMKLVSSWHQYSVALEINGFSQHTVRIFTLN